MQQQLNAQAGVVAAAHSAAILSGAAVSLPPSASNDALADARNSTLPSSKVFVKQPPYIINGEMREYQIAGLNWMINRHESQAAARSSHCAPAIAALCQTARTHVASVCV